MAFQGMRVLSSVVTAMLLAACVARPTGAPPTSAPPTYLSPTGASPIAPTVTANPECPGNLPSDPAWVCRKDIPTESAGYQRARFALGVIDVSSADQLSLLFTAKASWGEYGYGHIAFSPDSRYVALGSSGSPLYVFALPWREQGVLEVPPSGLSSKYLGSHANALAFSPDSRQIALALVDEAVVLVDPATAKPQATLEPIPRPSSVAFVEGGTRLVVGTDTWPAPSLQLWDLPSTSLIRDLAPGGTNGGVCDVAVSPDGKVLAASYCLYSYRVLTWDIATQYSPLTTMYGLNQPPYDCGHCSFDYFRNILAFAPNSATIASATGWDDVVLFDPRTGKLRFVLWPARMIDVSSAVDPGPIAGIAFGADGHVLVIAAGSELQLRNPLDGMFLLHTQNPSGSSFGSVAISPDSRLLVTVDWDGVVGFWGVPPE